MNNFKESLTLLLLFCSTITYAQVGIGTESPHPSSIVDVSSSQKGFLMPRLANPNQINLPANGLMIYNTTFKCIQVNKGIPSNPNWECLGGTSNPVVSGPIQQSDCELVLNNNFTFESQAEWTDGARVVEMVNINGTTTYNNTLSAVPTANWTPQGGLYSIADQNSPCYSTKVNDDSAITWTNANPVLGGGGSGGFVFDIQTPKDVNFVSIFNTPSDGTVTHFELKYHTSTSPTPPAYNDPDWVTVFAKTSIEYYDLDSTFVTTFQGTNVTVNRFTSGMTYSLPETINARYWRGEAWNDGSLSGQSAPIGYIEVRQVKLMKLE